jgi:hypothetical protein
LLGYDLLISLLMLNVSVAVTHTAKIIFRQFVAPTIAKIADNKQILYMINPLKFVF